MKAKIKFLIIAFLFFNFFSSVAFSKNITADNQDKTKIEQSFDKEKWGLKQGKNYPHRNAMLNDIVYTDKFRKLKKKEILEVLGNPSYYRDDKHYLHYRAPLLIGIFSACL